MRPPPSPLPGRPRQTRPGGGGVGHLQTAINYGSVLRCAHEVRIRLTVVWSPTGLWKAPSGCLTSSRGVSHKPHSVADQPSDWLCLVTFVSSAAAALRSKLKVRIRALSWPPRGPGGVLQASGGVSHKPHSAADIRSDLFRFVEFVFSVAAVSHSTWKVPIRTLSCSPAGLWRA